MMDNVKMMAKPVWIQGQSEEKLITAGFRAVFSLDEAVRRPLLRVAASTLYRAYVDGKFVAYGPARGPHGYFRVDEWPLDGLTAGGHIVAIECTGYNINSFALLDQPSFLQAEMLDGARVVCMTGASPSDIATNIAPFLCAPLNARVRRVGKFSYQRALSEVYRLSPRDNDWRTDTDAPFSLAQTECLPEKRLIPRHAPLPRFSLRRPAQLIARGSVMADPDAEVGAPERSFTWIGKGLKGFNLNELEANPLVELRRLKTNSRHEINRQAVMPEPLKDNGYAIFGLSLNKSGFLGLRVFCEEKTRMYVTFDEILSSGDVKFDRLGCVGAVTLDLAPGEHAFESIEPYTCQYIKCISVGGECRIDDLYLREYENPESHDCAFSCDDNELNEVFLAAAETFRQSAVDVFMDNPSRERAGWLCDSYFSARAAWYLTGNTAIERSQFENFSLPESFYGLPSGMLPMCYPSDTLWNHATGAEFGEYIPNWALWFLIQLREYVSRSGDTRTLAALKNRVYALLDWFKRYENADGLLEKLDGWVFIEWSEAAKFVQDVSYPTNMLYSGALSAVAALYDDASLASRAESVAKAVREQSFDGEFFVDNAIRTDGRLTLTRNRSEICQYYAFFFDVATPDTYPELWDKLLNVFGPGRLQTGAYPEIYMANAFIGYYLRIELLSRGGCAARLLADARDYCLYMARRTGTLWEMADDGSSCAQGFSSHMALAFLRDGLGILYIDGVKKEIVISVPDNGLAWCRGALPLSDGGRLSVSWRREKNETILHYDVSGEYSVRVLR